MPKRADFIFEIRIINREDLTLDSVVREPRTFRPHDVNAACRNLTITASEGSPPSLLETFIRYVITEFFAQAHGTGLYNRQSRLWESVSRIASIEAHQLSRGIFKKEKISEFDIFFLDHKGRHLIAGHVADLRTDKKPNYVGVLKAFLRRAELKPGIHGIFACYPTPLPEQLIKYVCSQTNGKDPIAKYESILPKLEVPLDLLDIDVENPLHNGSTEAGENCLNTSVRLIHPDLTKKKKWATPVKSSSPGGVEEQV